MQPASALTGMPCASAAVDMPGEKREDRALLSLWSIKLMWQTGGVQSPLNELFSTALKTANA